MFRIRVLGSFKVLYRGQELDLQPKQNLVLLALVWAHGPASRDRLVDMLLDHHAPGSQATLRSHFRRIRDAVRAAEGDERELYLRYESGGQSMYELHPGVRVDVFETREQVRLAQTLYAGGEVTSAAGVIAGVLTQWHDPAIPETAQGWAGQLRDELGNLHRLAVHTGLRADISLDLHQHAVGELAGLVRKWPEDGDVWQLLITALYRCNRTTEAVHASQQALEIVRAAGYEEARWLDLQTAVLNETLPMRGVVPL